MLTLSHYRKCWFFFGKEDKSSQIFYQYFPLKTTFSLCCFCFIGPKAQYILTIRAFNDYGESKPTYLKAKTGQCPELYIPGTVNSRIHTTM